MIIVYILLQYMYLGKFLYLKKTLEYNLQKKIQENRHSYEIPNLWPGVEAKTTPGSCSGQPVVGGGVVLCARRTVRIHVAVARLCYPADPDKELFCGWHSFYFIVECVIQIETTTFSN